MMREAIVIALADFKGALVVVSHDRHLLTTSTNEFYLVSEGKVSQFNGDLDAYHEYLIELDKKQNKEKEEQHKTLVSQKSSNKTKEQKRIEAAFRDSLRPLKKEIEKFEERLNELNDEKAKVEEILASSEIYEASKKDELKEVLQKERTIKEELEEVELNWLTLNEELEAKINQFNQEQNL